MELADYDPWRVIGGATAFAKQATRTREEREPDWTPALDAFHTETDMVLRYEYPASYPVISRFVSMDVCCTCAGCGAHQQTRRRELTMRAERALRQLRPQHRPSRRHRPGRRARQLPAWRPRDSREARAPAGREMS